MSEDIPADELGIYSARNSKTDEHVQSSLANTIAGRHRSQIFAKAAHYGRSIHDDFPGAPLNQWDEHLGDKGGACDVRYQGLP